MRINRRDLLRAQKFNDKFSRLDLIVRYLFLEFLYGKTNIESVKDLYLKMQKKRTGSLNHINGKSYIQECTRLAKSFADNGYIKEYPLIVNENKHLINSSHRAACCLFWNIEDIPLEINKSWKNCLDNPNPIKQTYFDYGLGWFRNNDFSEEEITIIENKRKEIFLDLGLCFKVVLWDPIKEYFEDAEEHIQTKYSVIKSECYDLGGEYEKCMRQLYEIDDVATWKVDKKISFMKNPSHIKVLTLDIFDTKFRNKTQNKDKIISIEIESLKKDIRQKYKDKIDNYFYDIIVHAGDNYEHTDHISKVLKLYEDKKVEN